MPGHLPEVSGFNGGSQEYEIDTDHRVDLQGLEVHAARYRIRGRISSTPSSLLVENDIVHIHAVYLL